MRPIRLSMEGFTCFRERQSVLDFSGLELFSITGPTGVGKSSLLDAMTFALYGRVPRVGKSISELISLGADRMSVLFDFRLGEREYRLTRVARRGRATQAQLAELRGGLERSLAGGVVQVDAAVEELVGLGYEAFTRAVVLPQGEFAHFLKSPPREQREILRDLLRLSIYERMRKQAAEKLRGLKSDRENVDRRLDEDYAEVEEERIQALRSQAERNEHSHQDAQRRLGKLEAERARLTEWRAILGELDRETERLRKIDACAEEFARLSTRIDEAGQVAPLLQLLEAFDQATRRRLEAENRLTAIQEAKTLQEEALVLARDRMSAVREEEKALPALRERLQALDEAQALEEPRRLAGRRLDEAIEKRESVAQQLDSAESEFERGKRSLAEQTEAHKDFSDAISELAYDPQHEELLASLRTPTLELASVRKLVEHTRREVETRSVQRDALDTELESVKSELKLHKKHFGVHERQVLKSRRALEQARQQDVKAHLRSSLELGCPCPVCEQRVTELPEPIQGSLLDTLSVQLGARESELQKAGAILASCERVFEEKKAERSALTGELKRLKRRFHLDEKRLANEERELLARAEPVGLGSIDSTEAELLQRIKQQEDGRKEYLRKKDSLAELSNACRDLEARLQVADERRTKERLRLEELNREIVSAREELNGYEKKVSLITSGENPVSLRDEVAEKIELQNQKLREVEAVFRVANANLDSTQASWVEAIESHKLANAECDERLAELALALKSSSFESVERAREAIVPRDELEEARAKLEAYRQDEHSVRKRVDELTGKLSLVTEHTGETPSGSNTLIRLEEVEAEWARETERSKSAVRLSVELSTQADALESRLEKARELREELARLISTHSTMHQLATDLRSEHFQAFLLEQAFQDLVRGASSRLRRITSRYTLDYSDGSFRVYDHDHASELRSADTLSGGETFLVSLMLALELSAQVQAAAGAVRLDSLFIDEGFGTLDQETLELVAAALEGLQLEGRMVGVITHLSDLTTRLPAVIRVERHGAGSRVRQDGELAYNVVEPAP